jgi:hypothetical protein
MTPHRPSKLAPKRTIAAVPGGAPFGCSKAPKHDASIAQWKSGATPIMAAPTVVRHAKGA